MVHTVRRVITGHNEKNQSTFILDGIANSTQEMASMPGVVLTDIWETLDSPADNRGNADAVARPVRLEPPGSGSILRLVEFPPDSVWRGADASQAFGSIGASSAPAGDSDDPMRHRTDTIDYIIILKGEIHAILDTGETLLKAGDVLVQRGTVHSWSVRGSENCVLAAVLIKALPHAANMAAVQK